MYLLHFSIQIVQQGRMNKFISQKSGNTAILKDNPLFYLISW